MKNLVTFLVVGVLIGTGPGATAQELLVPPAAGPLQMELPADSTLGSSTRDGMPIIELPTTPLATPNPPSTDLEAEPIASGDLQLGLHPLESGDDYRLFDCDPALLESTGTWLRRGFWYSEVDAVLMDRVWRRDGMSLMLQDTGSSSNTGNSATAATSNILGLDGGRTGVEGLPRLKIGRFLFRDYKNRDHAAEMIVFGGGQWSMSGRLDAVDGGRLEVGARTTADNVLTSVRFLLDQGNISFDGASSTQFEYDSRFNNFELNYRVKSRMRKDRMELEPSGHWVRRAQPSVTRSLMAGIRYFDVNEDLDWDAFDIDDPRTVAVESETGNYRIRTDNDLIGTQLGGSFTYETARWSLGLQTKSGMYLNHTDVTSSFEVTGGITSGSNEITVDNLSFITEGSLTGKWHVRPNFSLRAGLEILYVSAIALAPEQINFIPVSTSQLVGDGSATYMGGSIGFERYW